MTDEEKKDQLSRRMRQKLAEKGMSQSELARAAGVDRARVSSYIGRKTLPNRPHLMRIAEALGVKPEWLRADFEVIDPPLTLSLSADGRSMRVVCDMWVSAAVGAQIVQLLSDAAPTTEE